jgi:hypothetical protein
MEHKSSCRHNKSKVFDDTSDEPKKSHSHKHHHIDETVDNKKCCKGHRGETGA